MPKVMPKQLAIVHELSVSKKAHEFIYKLILIFNYLLFYDVLPFILSINPTLC